MVPVFAFTSRPGPGPQAHPAAGRGSLPHKAPTDDYLTDVAGLFAMLKKKRLVKRKDRLVIASGVPVGIPQWTNVIRVETVP